MNKRHWFVMLLVLLSALLLVATLSAAPADINTSASAANTKQIAAPPADMLNGSLSLPNPVQTGVRSRTAMLPINLTQTAAGEWAWTGQLPVDSANASLMILSPAQANWQVAVQMPGGHLTNIATLAQSAQDTSFGLEGNQYPGRLYTFAGQPAGLWTVQVTAVSPTNGYLLLSTDSSIQLYTHLSTHALLTGQPIGLVTYAYDAQNANGAATAVPSPLRGVITSATAQVQTPDGQTLALPMWDDGSHADGLAGDGIFGAWLETAVAGQYISQINVTGATAQGEFVRTSEHTFPVLTPALTLAQTAVSALPIDDTRLTLKLRGTALNGTLSTVQASAEVWGTNASGTAVPVAWISGLVTPQQQGDQLTFPLSLDARWISLAGAQAPFELRQVRVQDVNTHIPLAQADRLALHLGRLPAAASTPVTAVTDDMLMGVKPETAVRTPTYVGGHVLLLIHGYCSGNNPWPTSHFTNYALFQDLNQNRSHDQFAQLIQTFGANYDSFGAVAHSQGGDASLHLYTYYWSGFDYSTGSRLIQSVGTPYQGTALAGNLALLGELFGAGCGTNWDLTYDGAALWLSGIPSWARSRVYYATTSFKDVWYRYDYCHIATDLFLSDPDDGVIERWAGQLSGANNMGHKTGWCHTTGMRDPAQTGDYSRNSNMNTYANR